MSKQLKQCQEYIESINISINSNDDWETSIGSYLLVKKNSKYHLDSLTKTLVMVNNDLYKSFADDFKYKHQQLIKESEKQRLRNINLEVQVDFWKHREKRLHSYLKRFFKGVSFNNE
jgi:hypothetical protein